MISTYIIVIEARNWAALENSNYLTISYLVKLSW